MILQSLVSYYEALAVKGEISRPGWSKVKVSYALELDETGQLIDVLPLKTPTEDGKKMVPREMELPERERNSADTTPCFLCDDRRYVLGIPESDEEKHIKKAEKAFDVTKAKYTEILSRLKTTEADALITFFETWDKQKDQCVEKIAEISAGENIVFFVQDCYAHEVNDIRDAWDRYYRKSSATVKQRCLVTGEVDNICRIHPSFNVPGGTNPKLVSFDEDSTSFCSYGKDKQQGLNAPVGNTAAAKYGNALKYLLGDDKHSTSVGNMKVVYWADEANHAEEAIFSKFFNLNNEIDDDLLDDVMPKILSGRNFNFEGVLCKPTNNFYIIGLYASAKGRIGVRFFLRDSFGNMVRHLQEHYDRLNIVTDNRSKFKNIPLWALLRETVNEKSKDKSPSPQMSGDTLRAILTGGRYPATLYNKVLIRIRAEQSRKDDSTGKSKPAVTRERVAIIKAYLMRNYGRQIKEDLTMEKTKSIPYTLGCLFSALENIQQTANSGLNATIKDRYFNSACATPLVVFPTLLKLKNHHIRVIAREMPGLSRNMEKEIGCLISEIGMSVPAHLSLEEQGVFILGYYHQNQKRYEKKDKAIDIMKSS